MEILNQKSRFIGHCFPVSTEEEALARLEELRHTYRDASHNCYAYSIGSEGGAARFSDDGEPAGTAGMPMMEAVRQKEVTDLLCVVTRYFGGILLGAGGLVRAYSKAASAAISAAEPVWMRPCVRYSVAFAYPRLGTVEPLARKAGVVEDIVYAEDVRLTVTIPDEACEAFIAAVIDKTDGQVHPKQIEACYGRFPII